jgi:hypothetical protein
VIGNDDNRLRKRRHWLKSSTIIRRHVYFLKIETKNHEQMITMLKNSNDYKTLRIDNLLFEHGELQSKIDQMNETNDILQEQLSEHNSNCDPEGFIRVKALLEERCGVGSMQAATKEGAIENLF